MIVFAILIVTQSKFRLLYIKTKHHYTISKLHYKSTHISAISVHITNVIPAQIPEFSNIKLAFYDVLLFF